MRCFVPYRHPALRQRCPGRVSTDHVEAYFTQLDEIGPCSGRCGGHAAKF
ncbi:hypothetical protein LPH44_07375 [Xylella taiwanensis]|uniref:Uncharacterized protein n=1 Tax=Xylella taiwanensis TaxID=1444770 RepID=A0ABS8TSN3_9GAMM|nr:hypothetical protein [Xylella taiwanensis]MCD8465882.1 hypothetical protein [Xylella taiwanensis]MCD8472084.1 hypothetical protein [Xylella taiwanensis]UFN06995.1 hypothetical protein LPH42_00985 [Xylella taiwanensis]UFN09293.1 hypothetical protein LPH45_01020 [Xylella taiwanensis]UFN10572.1 hypothetical protein LPH44_07375 [Xylella taiwanensis]